MSKQSELVGLARTTNLDEVNAAYSAGALSNRNLIINGAMQVAQRGTSVAGVSGGGFYVCDRWQYRNGSAGTGQEATHEQSTDAPSGFQNSYKVSCTVADATPLGSENEMLCYKLEGYDVSHLDYGTSSAKTVTLSFWVKSTVTGAYGVQFFSSSTNPSALKSYNISSASTWEYKTIRLDGDTITPFPSGNVQALTILFHLACGPDDITSEYEWTSEAGFRSVTGQANVFATTSDTFQITGVQLEVGDTATPFEHRSYAQELALCQRYYELVTYAPGQYFAVAFAYNATQGRFMLNYSIKRATPSIAFDVGQSGVSCYYNGSSNDLANLSISSQSNTSTRVNYALTTVTQPVGNAVGVLSNAGVLMHVDAEL